MIRSLMALIPLLTLTLSCAPAPPPPDTLDNGLLLALAVLEKGPDGRPVPQPAQLGILTDTGDGWSYTAVSDPDSNVFHKAMVYEPRPGEAGILTAGGTGAKLKFWRQRRRSRGAVASRLRRQTQPDARCRDRRHLR